MGHVLVVDAFDRNDLVAVAKEVRAFGLTRAELGKAYGRPGRAAFEDLFLALLKSVPDVVPLDGLSGDEALVRTVVVEALASQQVESLRRFTIGDRVQAALCAVALEGLVRWVLDAFALNRVPQLRLEVEADTNVAADADDAVDEAVSANESVEKVDALVELALAARRGQEERQRALEAAEAAQGAMVRAQVALNVGPLLDEQRSLEATGRAWGVDAGSMMRIPVKDRLALQRKLATPALRDVAELYGKMRPVSTSLVDRPTRGVEQMVGLTRGSDFDALAGSEWVNLAVPELRTELMLRAEEGELLIHDLRGANAGRGGIILAVDGSFSMNGARERYAKALLLSLWHIARDERRTFHVVHFAARTQIRHFPFVTPADFTFERLVECIELSWMSGTDFETPMRKCVEILEAEFAAQGKVESDVVFATDDECGVSAGFMAGYLAATDRLHATTWGVLVSNRRSVPNGPLEQMSRGKVSHVTDLVSGSDVEELLLGAA